MCGIGCLIGDVQNFDHNILNIHKDNEIDHHCGCHTATNEQQHNYEQHNSIIQFIEKRISNAISPRGPNGTTCITVVQHDNENSNQSSTTIAGDVYISFQASLLALRGTSPVFQPVTDERQNTLAWNGQLYDCNEHNDTLYLLNKLSDTVCEQDVYRVLSELKGPFSFVYFNTAQQKLYFGRDVLGRRSLLYIYNEQTKMMALSSVACDLVPAFPNYDWRSISTFGIFCYDLSTHNISSKSWSDIYQQNEKKWVLSPRTFIVPTESNDQDTVYPTIESLVDTFTEKLMKAVKKRVTNILRMNDTNNDSFSIGILFSGGIDSVILTALAYLSLRGEMSSPSASNSSNNSNNGEYFIDLLNVSFGSDINQIQNSADRKQSITAWKELKQLYPDAPFRLILINIFGTDLDPVRSTIEQLIYPQSTVIDFNIGSALWFASRGCGILYTGEEDSSNTVITSNARVLLCGIGSDEQLGGYKRHKNAFTRAKGNAADKWLALNNEMDMDVARLWVRNLGRDDRIIAYHGREARNPFLDEDFVMFVRSIPLWIIANFGECEDQNNELPGDKKILRLAAHKMGLTTTSTFVKRAMQFGSNVAKVSYRKQHADTNIDIRWK